MSFSSAITVRRQVVLGFPCLLFPGGVNLRADLGIWSWSILRSGVALMHMTLVLEVLMSKRVCLENLLSLSVFSCTFWEVSIHNDSASLTIFGGTPYDRKIFHRVSRCTVSNAFWKIMKLMNRGVVHSMQCSMMLLRAKTWCMHPRPLRNSGKKNPTVNHGWNWQKCDSPPVVTTLGVSLLRNLDN